MGELFRPFRALGYITDDVPFAVQRRGKETYVTVSVGRTWQVRAFFFLLFVERIARRALFSRGAAAGLLATPLSPPPTTSNTPTRPHNQQIYNCAKLTLVMVGPPLARWISSSSVDPVCPPWRITLHSYRPRWFT